jgi:hypothetical protein
MRSFVEVMMMMMMIRKEVLSWFETVDFFARHDFFAFLDQKVSERFLNSRFTP